MGPIAVVEVEVCGGCDRVMEEKQMNWCTQCWTYLCDECATQGKDCRCSPTCGDCGGGVDECEC